METVPSGAEKATADGHGTVRSSWKLWSPSALSLVGGTCVAAGPRVGNLGQGIWDPAGRHRVVTNLGIGTVEEGGCEDTSVDLFYGPSASAQKGRALSYA